MVTQPLHTNELTEEEIAVYKDVFSIFDKDGDGTICAAELGSIMRSLGQQPSDTELEDMINEMDTDSNGTIDFQEFQAMMTRNSKPTDTQEELKQAFKVFDRDNSGTISADELRQVLKSLGDDFTDKEIDEMMKQADLDGNGSIDYDEFVRLMEG